jgi:hypothetical protein
MDQAWSDFIAHIERQVEVLDRISGSLANIVPRTSTIERKTMMQNTLEHYRQETVYFAKLLAEIKKATLAA